MIRTRIGIDYEGVSCVKITKGERDPMIVPDAEKSAFHYNSKFSADVKLTAFESTPPGGTQYWPAGANDSNYTKKRANITAGADNITVLIRNSHFPGLPYAMPLYDLKIKRRSDSRYLDNTRVYTQGSEDPSGREPGYRTLMNWYNQGWLRNGGDNSWGSPTLGNGLYYLNNAFGQTDFTSYEKTAVVWRLPGDDTPLIDSVTPSITPGLRTVEISDTWCRVAKPGYDTRTATPTQMAFDSSGQPLSVIKAGDVALPAGATNEIEVGFPGDNSMVCDILQYEQDEIRYPISGYFTVMNCEYWFSGTKLYIYNPQTASRARYLVFSRNAAEPTSGNNNVLRQFNDGTQDVVQFLRPGAGNDPSLADIILDSRWPALQMLAEGYIPVSAQSNKVPPSVNTGIAVDVPFDGAGFFPFVKFSLHMQNGFYGEKVQAPSARLIESYNNSFRYVAENTVFCVLTGNNARFISYEGNPISERHSTSSGWQYDYSANTLLGIRYYILGIPAP
ncbi:hypothetical protein [Rhizobium sp. YS-1r]|uniref:hypothetical protein n=1 Tax=Rhizobium sp. YS-1r TaxID=1532558 RepID=UPI00050E4E2B|nr:hypothetical protein [Rhizobium sp. YS-1r]KGE01008.1 hypothetical protein JL39_07655 [Rhizobium sp. YS-1r]